MNNHDAHPVKHPSEDRRGWHLPNPYYDRPGFQMSLEQRDRVTEKLGALYGQQKAEKAYKELERLLKVYHAYKTEELIEAETKFVASERLTERDTILITYGDLVIHPDKKPLHTLAELCKRYLKGAFNILHILPFFPYSSDRGFSVMDFEEVDPNLGTWTDILELKSDFQLMFDGVFNHVSSKSRWFQEYLNANPAYRDFFTEFSTRAKISEDHLKLIVRPRTSDILTRFSTLNGPRMVWTTFSPDQIDLNYQNPKVLLKMVEILLTYVRRGADFIRLDAVTYLWEQLGTTCAHLDQSHITIKLFRDILDAVAPHVALITETNVPHEDNIRYFGNGYDEAQMIYNFALPPLVLHAFQTGNASALTEWAASLTQPSDQATYLNFLDSHDGVGVMGAKNILSSEDIEMMALRVVEHGGYISYKDNSDGTESPYELNITWYSALNRADAKESTEFQVKRYLASRAIALAFMGVPGVYLHGLLGSKNDAEAVLTEYQRRSINRKNINKEDLITALQDQTTSTSMIFHRFVAMVQKRIVEKAFHPNARQQVLTVSDELFVLLRTSVRGNEHILAITNVTDKMQQAEINMRLFNGQIRHWHDLLSGRNFQAEGNRLTLKLEPYDVFWLKAERS